MNNRIQKKIKILIILFSMFFLISCSEGSGETNLNCSIDEVQVDGECIANELIELGKVDNANYTFEVSFTDEEKRSLIDKIEVIVDYLIYEDFAQDKELNYIISEQSDNYLEEYDNTIHLSNSRIDSFDTVFNSLLSLYESNANFGLIYGLASYISIDLGYIERDNRSDESVISYFLNEDKKDLMDLTYPTLDESYTSGGVLKNAEDFASHFTRHIIENEGIEKVDQLLNISDFDEFEYEYKIRLNWFIGSNGFVYEVAMNEYPIFFDRNPKNYHAMWYTNRATWYLHESYGNNYENHLFGDFMFESYKTLKENIILFEDDMTRIDNILKNETVKYGDLKIFIQGNINLQTTSTIYLNQMRFFSHEYIHYITWPYIEYRAKDEWLREGVASYYSEDFFYQKEVYEYLILERNFLNGSITNRKNPVKMFKELYEREVDFIKDRNELYDMFAYLADSYDLIYQQDAPWKYDFLYISLNNYFIETYGEETYKLAFIDSSIINDLTNTTWEEIVNDWEQYIKAKYE